MGIELPDIIVSHEDHEQLLQLALQPPFESSAAAILLRELRRARLVPAEQLPIEAVAMNAFVDFEYDGARYRDFRLVYPQRADVADGRISVLTPVGAGLIGLSKGQSLWWPGRARRIHRLTVTKVNRPITF